MFNPSATDSFDEMAFHSHFPVHRACSVGDVQTVSILLEKNPRIAVLEDCYKHLTPIHWAATFGRLDCIRQVASVEPNVCNIQSSESFRTPLHCASEAGHPHCVLWLLQAGANPEVKDSQGETALHKAARNGKAECVCLLMATGCNVSTQNSCGQTACMVAEHAGFVEIASFIRKSEMLTDLVSRENPSGIPVPRFSRKRTRDFASDGQLKRMRTDEVVPTSPPPFRNCMRNTMSTSIVDHEKMCLQEVGYANAFLESMFSEIHGC